MPIGRVILSKGTERPVTALKFAMKHNQLRWLYITSAIANLGFIGTINYQVIMTYGYAGSMASGGEVTESILNAVSTGVVTQALFMFPVGCSVSQVIMGFISDSKGRKTAGFRSEKFFYQNKKIYDILTGRALSCFKSAKALHDEMEKLYGSTEGYLRDALELSDDNLIKLRSMYLV